MRSWILKNPRGRVESATISQILPPSIFERNGRFHWTVKTKYGTTSENCSSMEAGKKMVAQEFTGGDGIRNVWIEDKSNEEGTPPRD